MKKTHFIHLNIHSDYSISDGLGKIELLINKIAELNMPACAITDFTNLFGLIKFYNQAYKVGIKPIIGSDFYIESEWLENKFSTLTILAKNNIGYKNLILLISTAYKKRLNNSKLIIKKEWILKNKKGLILISGGNNGEISKLLLLKKEKYTEKCLNFYQHNFHNNFYLEISRIGNVEEKYYLNLIIQLAKKKSIPIVATNRVRFINKDDFKAHEIRVAINKGFKLSDDKRPKNYTKNQYIKTEKEMMKLFNDIPEALENSVEIAKRCNVTINLEKNFLPKFFLKNIKPEDYLIKKSKIGLEKRLKTIYKNKEKIHKKRKKYDKRLKYELKIINKMGFSGYFLIVMEFIQWAKKNKIFVGPGRGSGAGSLVAYSLKITDINPIQFDLLFERFLNPERISLPDFDIDFCMEKRDKVIEHVKKIYGDELVSQIATFGTMTAKAVIKDVGRVLGYPYTFVNKISKLIPFEPGITLEKAISTEPELKKLYNFNQEIKKLINTAKKLEGINRNIGKHAGGVVISPTKITDFSPIYYDQNGKNKVTQFDKDDIEKIGLVKFDFLGLKTLTIIDSTIKMINKSQSKNINITKISLKDKKCFEILKKAETTGIFQLESNGMKDLIKKLKPDCFEDVIALVALFRPGPLQSGMVDNFINRKHGKEIISYPDIKWQHESLKSILKPTYGIILYQEQVMQIAQKFSKYTLGQADLLRRAMSKKKPKEMIKQKKIFQKGSIKNGIDKNLSIKIFSLLEKFSSYGFNKSHSAAYAFISYQTLWLKTYYPSEFMASALNAEIDNTEKIVTLIDECKRIGIKILSPDINEGLYEFHVKNKKILYGLGAIKGVGKIAAENIIKSRKKNGKFKEIFDFCIKIDTKKINKRVIEKLIMSGAFDKIEKNRAKSVYLIKKAIKYSEHNHQSKIAGQNDLFETFNKKQMDLYTNEIKEWDKYFLLQGEQETLGLYLTGHPTLIYLKEINKYTNNTKIKDINKKKLEKIEKIIGLLLRIKIITTKNNKKIAICTLEDYSGRLNIVLFSNILIKYKSLLKINKILLVIGKVTFDKFRNHYQMIVYKLKNLHEVREKNLKCINIFINKKQNDNKFIKKILEILKYYESGKTPIKIYHKNKENNKKIYLIKEWKILPRNSLLNKLELLIGKKQIKLIF